MTDAHVEMLNRYISLVRADCPRCGHELGELGRGECPSCHESIELWLEKSRVRLAAFFVGLIGLAGGLGFSFIMFTAIVVMMLLEKETLPILKAVYPGVASLVFGAGLWVYLRLGSRLQRVPATARWGVACICVTIPLLSAALYLGTLL